MQQEEEGLTSEDLELLSKGRVLLRSGAARVSVIR